MMTKKFILISSFVILAILLLMAIAILYSLPWHTGNGVNSAALYVPLFTHTRCVEQKCLTIKGSGQNQCSNDENCLYANNPQTWCKSHNNANGMNSSAIRYPNGNFSCDCYYVNTDGSHAETPCADSHIQ